MALWAVYNVFICISYISWIGITSVYIIFFVLYLASVWIQVAVAWFSYQHCKAEEGSGEPAPVAQEEMSAI